MQLSYPRITITALKGGSGKTFLTLGMASAFKEDGKDVAAFKKGPDFIDPSWLSLAAGRTCRNLDPFMMDEPWILHSFLTHARDADLSLIEGNRGLFDGLDITGCCSSAELAGMLKSPVILIVDVTMTTRTIAAEVMGCQAFDPGLQLRGVILNKVGGARQEALVRGAVEHYCGVPVLGAVRRLKKNLFPERHMGLIPHREVGRALEAVDWARKVVRDSLDLDGLLEIARGAPSLEDTRQEVQGLREEPSSFSEKPLIGYIEDSAFWFYYPENLEELARRGAEIVPLSAVGDPRLPDLDALYIGGGFPETQAESLAANETFRRDLKERIDEGLPVYAECGGLMYLGENLIVGKTTYPMVGALPVDFVLEKRPQGHGYIVIQVSGENPFYEQGTLLKGHEFHYSRPVVLRGEGFHTAFKVRRGHGFDGDVDGLTRGNLLATYAHIHAAGTPAWARKLVRKAVEYQGRRRSKNLHQCEKRD